MFVAFQESAPPLPLSMIPGLGPAPTGQVLIHFTNNAVVAIGMAQPVVDPDFTYTRFSATFDFPPATRDLLQTIHPTFRWQGIGLDLSTGNFHATGLVRQHF